MCARLLACSGVEFASAAQYNIWIWCDAGQVQRVGGAHWKFAVAASRGTYPVVCVRYNITWAPARLLPDSSWTVLHTARCEGGAPLVRRLAQAVHALGSACNAPCSACGVYGSLRRATRSGAGATSVWYQERRQDALRAGACWRCCCCLILERPSLR